MCLMFGLLLTQNARNRPSESIAVKRRRVGPFGFTMIDW